MTFNYARRMDRVKPSIIREFARVISKPDIISFAGGAPASDLFPVEELKELSSKVLNKYGPSALQYSDTAGHEGLREKIVRRMMSKGVNTGLENLHILSGSQQGIDYASKIFMNPEDVVICERPTYLGAINAFASYAVSYTHLRAHET